MTESALRSFQQHQKLLEPSGRIDQQTLDALGLNDLTQSAVDRGRGQQQSAPSQQAGAGRVVGLPKIDLQKLCRASQLGALGTGGDSPERSIGSCVMDEQEARDQIIKSWSSYAASDRARCIQAGVYLPSYVEWLTCIEMTGDVRKLRAGQHTETVGAGSSSQRARRRAGIPKKQCPVLHYHDDGSVDWVIAC
jgi:hypothetical protein